MYLTATCNESKCTKTFELTTFYQDFAKRIVEDFNFNLSKIRTLLRCKQFAMNFIKASLVVVLLCGTILLSKGNLAYTNITFQLSATNLPSYDPFGGYPDPYVNITYENPPNPPLNLGLTEKLVDTPNATWSDVFSILYVNGSSQKLKLDLYDEDVDSDDYMGTVTVALQELTTTFGGVLMRDILLDNSTIMGQMIITANITESE